VAPAAISWSRNSFCAHLTLQRISEPIEKKAEKTRMAWRKTLNKKHDQQILPILDSSKETVVKASPKALFAVTLTM